MSDQSNLGELAKRISVIQEQVETILRRDKQRQVTTDIQSRVEYCTLTKEEEDTNWNLLDQLQAMGENGWCLCYVRDNTLYFSRLVRITHTYLLSAIKEI